MADNPREIVNPVVMDTVVSGSATILTDSENFPGKIILKVQITRPPRTSPDTLLIPLEPADAQQLHTALNACLAGTSH